METMEDLPQRPKSAMPRTSVDAGPLPGVGKTLSRLQEDHDRYCRRIAGQFSRSPTPGAESPDHGLTRASTPQCAPDFDYSSTRASTPYCGRYTPQPSNYNLDTPIGHDDLSPTD